jgi:hypothetical protein
MKRLNPITVEYMRRVSILILLALFAWMFFYSPSDIYEIQVKNYVAKYHEKVKNRSLDPSKTSMDEYIAYEMKSPYLWSKRKQKIVEVKGESGEFLNHIFNVNSGDVLDDIMSEHRSPDTFWSGNSYFFRSSELPDNFLSQTFLKHPNYLMIKDEDGIKRYFNLYKTERSSALDDAPLSVSHPLRIYSYLLLLLAILIYIYLPRPSIPSGAAYYTRLNAVYLPDVLSVFLWLGAWMFFFLPDDSAPMVVRYIFLLFFAIFALVIVLPTVKYASNWYLFTDDSFQWSDTDGIGSVPVKDVVSIKPYKKQLPKWVAPLIILFGRGQPVATGAGMISMSSSPEIGMEITIRSGKKIKVMANYLEADEVFTERFQTLEKKVKNGVKKIRREHK